MPEITNQGFIDKDGNHMTRCWNVDFPKGSRMYVVPTRPEDIKPESENHCYEKPIPKVSMRGHFSAPGITEGT